MEFVGVLHPGPGVGRFTLDCGGVQGAQVAGVLGQRPPERDRPGAAFFQGSVVQESVGRGVQYLVGEGRGLHRVPADDLDAAVADAAQHFLATFHVHGLGEAVPHGLEHQGMVGNLDVARHGVVLAGDLGWKHGCQQVLGPHADQGRRHLASTGVPQYRQGPGRIPAPAGHEQRGLQDRLFKDFLDVPFVQVGEYFVHGHGQAGAQGEIQAVVSGRGL